MKNESRTNWIPNIYYEEDIEGITRGFPFIEVPQDKDMPNCLFVYGIKNLDTKFQDEFEKEVSMFSYANMNLLKEKLSPEIFDMIRITLGLQPLHEAAVESSKMIENIIQNLKKEHEIQKNVNNMINRINEENLLQKE